MLILLWHCNLNLWLLDIKKVISSLVHQISSRPVDNIWAILYTVIGNEVGRQTIAWWPMVCLCMLNSDDKHANSNLHFATMLISEIVRYECDTAVLWLSVHWMCSRHHQPSAVLAKCHWKILISLTKSQNSSSRSQHQTQALQEQSQRWKVLSRSLIHIRQMMTEKVEQLMFVLVNEGNSWLNVINSLLTCKSLLVVNQQYFYHFVPKIIFYTLWCISTIIIRLYCQNMTSVR